MIRYNLDIQVPPVAQKLNYKDKVLMLGSCFSEHMSQRLQQLSFHVAAQPQGIVFNPISLAKPFELLQEKNFYTRNDLIENKGLWYCKYHHGFFSDEQPDVLLEKINQEQEAFGLALKDARFLFITFGSSWVYRLKESQEIVANCHKIPQARFEKFLLQAEDIVNAWAAIMDNLKTFNPTLQVVFTVSPVKHLRDGVVENNISKSILIYSIHLLRARYPSVGYFPSFELVNDDLRDYRFYDQDGAHPNVLAIEYVFGKFCETYMDDITLQYVKDMGNYNKLKAHRSIKDHGEEYEQFRKHLELARQNLEDKYGVNPSP
jgi:hypothetical protein